MRVVVGAGTTVELVTVDVVEVIEIVEVGALLPVGAAVPIGFDVVSGESTQYASPSMRFPQVLFRSGFHICS